MKNDKITSYITPKLEIIAVECNDVVTTSGIIIPGTNPGTNPDDNPSVNPGTPPDNTYPGGYVEDDNFLGTW